MKLHTEEYLEGLTTYPNASYAMRDDSAMSFFLRVGHQLAFDEGYYDEFEEAFPRFFEYINYKEDFMKLVKKDENSNTL